MQFPLSQRRHTNIAVVRYAKNGVKLEIACYKNKVISYRSGTETRLDEVLQVERIFTNVARGHLASEKDVEAVFGPDTTEQQAIKFMLDHGELQVAQQERTAEVDEMFKDIAIIISQKCVNTKTMHPFPSQVIEQALRSIGAAVKLDQPVKKQALGLIRSLIEADIIPIARANMKIRCTTTSAAALDKLRAWCKEKGVEIVERDPASLAAAASADGDNTNHSLLLMMQPHLFRDLDNFVKDELPAGSALHMVDAAVTEIGDSDAVLDPAAVSRANEHRGADGEEGVSGAPKATSTSSATGGRGRNRKEATSSAGLNTDHASSVSSTVDGGGGGGGAGGRRGKKGRRGSQRPSSEDDSEEDSSNEVPLMERAKRHGGVVAAAPTDELTARLRNLRIDNGSDGDDDGGRKGKGKRNNKKNTSAGGVAAGVKKGTPGHQPGEDSDGDDDDEDGGRKGKGKKNRKKKAATAAAQAKPEPVAEEAFSESDEELMVNRKQRAKKQHQEAQKDANNWTDEGDFDYGEDEEGEETQA
jgi:ribosome maturation protein SDO1